ncbi:hypothetical protein BI335_00150 [Enemella evansiae]|nr:hypothetical protein BI335_00150 [Enemella evansiae]
MRAGWARTRRTSDGRWTTTGALRGAPHEGHCMKTVKQAALWIIYALPPLFAGLYAGATEIADGSFTPWRPNMIDWDVYVRTAGRVLAGQDFYSISGDWLPFIYPPFAALLGVPFALLDKAGGQIVWLILNVLMVMAICYRLRFSGWQLSLVATASMWLMSPLRVTLGFGQVNILLMALVVYDLMPGPRVLRRRFLPEGWLTGIATAIKLTPAIFAVYLFLSGKVRAAIVTFLSFVAATVIGFVVLPGQSMVFWGRLINGDSGLNTGMKYYTNQSIIGNYVRFTEVNPDKIPFGGLVLAALVCVIGVSAAVLWHRNGYAGLAVCITGYTALLASPISWSHHFVWVLPLTIVLLVDKGLPEFLRFYGLGYAIWVMYAPFMQFKDGEDEFKYTLGQKLIDAGSMIFGIGFFLLAIGMAIWVRRRNGLPWLPLTLREREIGAPAAVGVGAGTGSGGATAVGSPVRDSAEPHHDEK